MEICPFCHIGRIRQTFLTYTEWYDRRLVVIPNTPAQICDHCGEKVFDPAVIDRLQSLLWTRAEPGETGTASASQSARTSSTAIPNERKELPPWQ
jgi:YgiT-type zinc finger domain-containing protein